MEQIIIIDSDKGQREKVHDILSSCQYRASFSPSLLELKKVIDEKDCRVIILNHDTVPADERIVKSIKKRNPRLNILVLSSKTFNPELKEVLRDHIYACLKLPLDADELIYWIKTICENDKELGS